LTNYFNDIRERTLNNPQALEEARRVLQRFANDHTRVPMRWDASVNVGFRNPHATPWLPALESCKQINVADQTLRKGSVLNFWRKLLLLRKQYVELFVYGGFQLLDSSTDVMLFTKHDPNSSRTLLTVANMSKEAVRMACAHRD
jgi:oligo-1,6-glucosidase